MRRRALQITLAALFSTGACAPTLYERALAEPGAVLLPTGNVVRELHPGDGATPKSGTWVKVAYEGRRASGAVFASSTERPDGGSFAFDLVSPCWQGALARMKVGASVRVLCTPESGSGEQGPRAGGGTASFDLTLLSVEDHEEVALPAGLVYRTLRPGTGEHPRTTDRVKVEYEGRLADGTVFDSTRGRDPAVLPLSSVITCWRDALPRMSVGEKASLTCPPDIAYGAAGQPPTIPPGATLTFEIELIAVERD